MGDNPLKAQVDSCQSKTFHSLGLSSGDYLRALERLGFTIPTKVQALSIPLGLDYRRNLIAQGKAGTGKTIAFSSILLDRILRQREGVAKESSPIALIILPTRELAIQVYEFIEKLIGSVKQVNSSLLEHINAGIFIGGLPLQDDRRSLKMQHVKIVVGTIGRIIALIKESALSLESINTVILDEADKLVAQKDFYKHIQTIFESLKSKKSQVPEDTSNEDFSDKLDDFKYLQFLAFSATYPDDLRGKLERLIGETHFVDAEEVRQILDEEGVEILDSAQEVKLDNITQFKVDILPSASASVTKLKVAAIVDLLGKVSFTQAIVFYNDKMKGENLHSELQALKYSVLFIHGDQSQADRIKLMNIIRRNKTQIIIATDLLARGIDISSIDLVINYDIPSDIETYFHRIGRTGRYNRFGLSVLLIQKSEHAFIDRHRQQFDKLQALPADFAEINARLQSKQDELKTEAAAVLKTSQTTPSSTVTGSSNYHHEFTQGIIRGDVDLEEKFYDESNFKYFIDTSEAPLSPVHANSDGVIDISGSMSLESSFSSDESNENDSKENDDINLEHNHQTKSHNEGVSEWGFLSCQTCHRFLSEQQTKLGKTFKILEHFTIPTTPSN